MRLVVALAQVRQSAMRDLEQPMREQPARQPGIAQEPVTFLDRAQKLYGQYVEMMQYVVDRFVAIPCPDAVWPVVAFIAFLLSLLQFRGGWWAVTNMFFGWLCIALILAIPFFGKLVRIKQGENLQLSQENRELQEQLQRARESAEQEKERLQKIAEQELQILQTQLNDNLVKSEEMTEDLKKMRNALNIMDKLKESQTDQVEQIAKLNSVILAVEGKLGADGDSFREGISQLAQLTRTQQDTNFNNTVMTMVREYQEIFSEQDLVDVGERQKALMSLAQSASESDPRIADIAGFIKTKIDKGETITKTAILSEVAVLRKLYAKRPALEAGGGFDRPALTDGSSGSSGTRRSGAAGPALSDRPTRAHTQKLG